MVKKRTLPSLEPTRCSAARIPGELHFADYVLVDVDHRRRDFHRLSSLSDRVFSAAFGQENVSEAAAVIGTQELSSNGLNEMRRFLLGPQHRLPAVAVLAMAGTRDEVLDLLASDDVQVRNVAEQYTTYRPDLDQISARVVCTEQHPARTCSYLRRQLELRRRIEAHILQTPSTYRAIRLHELIRLWDAQLSPGLQLQLANALDGLSATGWDFNYFF
jgi:hypothetical protein